MDPTALFRSRNSNEATVLATKQMMAKTRKAQLIPMLSIMLCTANEYIKAPRPAPEALMALAKDRFLSNHWLVIATFPTNRKPLSRDEQVCHHAEAHTMSSSIFRAMENVVKTYMPQPLHIPSLKTICHPLLANEAVTKPRVSQKFPKNKQARLPKTCTRYVARGAMTTACERIKPPMKAYVICDVPLKVLCDR